MQAAQHLTVSLRPDFIETIKATFTGPSSVHGVGLFTKTNRQPGEILTLLDGQVIGWDDYLNLDMPMEWNAVGENKIMVRPHRTSYGFINHSRDPNLMVDSAQRLLVALKPINAFDELFLDYRKEPLPADYIAGRGKLYL